MNVHLSLQQYRNQFAITETQNNESSPLINGPRILILGPKDSGKTSIVRSLANYAIRQRETPIIINLDPSEGMTTVPGTVSATSFSKALSPEDGFFSYSLLGSDGIIDYPLVYHYGYLSPNDQPILFKKIVKNLALGVEKQLALNKKFVYT
ncbi:mRNA cleavage and polyadenylation factor clp1 [Smittium culicis]|uniref:Polynucleotide 5'-hydroxyl-kinase GRC3 n=1 Tax=Smittium culicis TaxID=133412 RepID=A0A1R1Y4I7_9FUNG|nr:mRNA cleavage and polyadenylation factor clp1 [Smittium culicis]